MSYVLEVLPALLNGAVVTLQVFFIVIVLSIPLGIVLAFLMQIKFQTFKLVTNPLCLDYAWNTAPFAINLRLLRSSKCWDCL